MLDQFSRHQFERIIAVINENDQIYNRHAARYTNTEIVMAARQKMGSDYDYKHYPHFNFDEEKAFAEIERYDQEHDNEIPF